jgi:uncharacterized phage infection (PIP) family protein YhgE
MNIKTRLYVLTVLNVLICVTVGAIGYIGIERLHPQFKKTATYPEILEAMDLMQSAQDALRDDTLASLTIDTTLVGGGPSIETLKRDIRKHAQDLESAMAKLSTLPMPVEIPWKISDTRLHVDHLTNLAETLPDRLGRTPDALTPHLSLLQDTFKLLRSETSEAKRSAHALWKEEGSQTIAFAQSGQNVVFTALLIGVACIVGLVLITLRSIVQPIGGVIQELGRSAAEVETSAQRMSLCAEDLAQSATEQAAAVQESVASMTQMSSMIAQTGDSATESLASVRRMAERTKDGNRVMERLASSTEAINQANTRLQEMVDIIGEISGKTSVINDIVFKTQLLSFNASIEAARAGQHGRGFAVVAEGFGNLAEMSGAAAKEIQSLLETSRKHVIELVEMTQYRVADGLAVSKEALSIFHEISRDTNQITKQIQRISEATREQNIGVQQASTAMNQMDQAAQRSSLLAGDTLRGSTDLSEQSRKLAAIMRGLLALITAKETKAVGSSTSSRRGLPRKTQVFECNDDDDSLDHAFLQDAAAKLESRARRTRTEEVNADDEDFHPYDGSSPR